MGGVYKYSATMYQLYFLSNSPILGLMRTKPLQCILTFLALLGMVHGGHITSIAECTARAWVRAPDLAPNTIVQGDARVKISAECPAVESVTLGLRFKERSFVKAL